MSKYIKYVKYGAINIVGDYLKYVNTSNTLNTSNTFWAILSYSVPYLRNNAHINIISVHLEASSKVPLIQKYHVTDRLQECNSDPKMSRH